MAHACNEDLATKLRMKAESLPAHTPFRICLSIAANNIQDYPYPIKAESEARKVKGVGPAIVKELLRHGLAPSTNKRDLAFVEGANSLLPKKIRHGVPMACDTTVALQQSSNAIIADSLRAQARNKPDPIRTAMRKAASNIEGWPAEIQTAQQCVAIPGVGVDFAMLIITQILNRTMTAEEQSFLAGAEMQAQRLGVKEVGASVAGTGAKRKQSMAASTEQPPFDGCD